MKNKIISFLLVLSVAVMAKELPIEKSIVRGQLENGMTYTIKKNSKPKGTAEFKLLVKVGSLEEEDDQKGIAHFVEHMAFNGSKHFAKNDLIEYLESIGVGFGSDLNANTGHERTLYKLTVPIEKDNIEKSFLFFQDLAGDLSFDKEEFDKERGVILEEARSRNNLGFRIRQKLKSEVYANSKYLDRTPIGDLNIVKNIDASRAKEFWHDWYRPEFMHFVAVGDFDIKEMNQTIHTQFSTLKNRTKKVRASREIPANNSTRILNLTDKEMTSNSISISYFQAKKPIITDEDLKDRLIRSMAISLFNLQAKEQFLKDNPKANVISMRASSLSLKKSNVGFSAMYSGANGLPALQELYEIMFSFEKYGFAKENLKIIKINAHKSNEQSFKKRFDRKSTSIASSLVSYALSGNTYIDYQYKYDLKKKLINEITIADINKVFNTIVANKDRLVLFTNLTGKEVSKAEVLASIQKAQENAKDLTQVEKVSQNLISKDLPLTQITKETHDKETDIYEFILENGIKVAFKKTDFSKNSLSLRAFSFGGTSVYEVNALNDAKKAAKCIAKSGAGKYSMVDLPKVLAGKKIRVGTYISKLTEGINASANSNDINAMFELMYLKLTEPKVDMRLIKNAKRLLTSKVQNAERNPAYKFRKEFSSFYYKDNPRIKFDTAQSIKELNVTNMLEIYKDRFSDMNNFVFVLVGDSEVKDIKSAISKYLGNLPTKKRKETFVDRSNTYLKGEQKFARAYSNENISKIKLIFKSKIKYSIKDSITLQAMRNILNIRLRKLIREDKSGVYGISMMAGIRRLPKSRANAIISFSCDPARKDELIGYVYREIERLKQDEVSQEELAAYKKKFAIRYKKNLKSNKYWLSNIIGHYKYNTPINNIFQKNNMTQEISKADIKNIANSVFVRDIMQSELSPKGGEALREDTP